MARRKCRHGEHWADEADVYLTSRKSGGSYRRSQTSQRTGICGDCAMDLLPHYSPGSLSVSNWDAHGLADVVAKHAARTRDVATKSAAYAALSVFYGKRAARKAQQAEWARRARQDPS